MLIPMLHQGFSYYLLLPLFWSLFIIVFYVLPAYLMPYFMKHCIKVVAVDRRNIILSGVWAFFFALPFVHAFADNFVFLFFITTRSLIMFAGLSFIFQFLYIKNVSSLLTQQILLSLCLSSLIGYWLTCLFYYLFSYTIISINSCS